MNRITSRRSFLQTATLAGAAVCSSAQSPGEPAGALTEFQYGDVELASGAAQTQFEQTQSVLFSLNEDGLLKPWRIRAGLPAPGPDLGGWYDEVPPERTESGGHGFAPAHCFGQWISALARGYAVNRDSRARAKLERLLDLYRPAISGRFYKNFPYPAYNYDKMVLGLTDAYTLAGVTQARDLLEQTTNAAEPHLPPTALDRGEPQRRWRESLGDSTDNASDESYTIAENLYLAWERGAGERYKKLAARFLLDKTYFDPLSENQNILADHHAYSFCNALSSAMKAYLATGSVKHLKAGRNAFDMIERTQSFATGGWGPNESFSEPGSGALYASLSGTHRGFETPCGSYAHFKLTRYLLRVTREGRYGDSMERVLYNTVLGSKRLEPDGHAFYYSDYHSPGKKTYFPDAWPCCSGTLPQVATDYRILIYFRDHEGIFINLYLPSTLRWTSWDGAQMALTQDGEYPLEGTIHMRVKASRPSVFPVRLRIPGWTQAKAPVLRVNGEPVAVRVQAGFATVQRRWRDGDRVQLDMPLPLRLEPIDAEHPDTVALVRGPLVLFPITESTPSVTRRQLLQADRVAGATEWRASAMPAPLILRPFTAIADEPYRTYLTVA